MSRHGQTGILVENIRIDETKETGTATISYTVQGSVESARAGTPAYKSRSQLIPAAYRLETKSIETTGTGNSCKVTLTYKISESEDSDSDGFELGGDEKKGTVRAEHVDGKASILLHPKFDKVPELHKILAKAFIDGVVPYDTVFVLKEKSNDKTQKQGDASAAATDLPVFRTSITKAESSKYEATSFKEAVDRFVTKGKYPLSHLLFRKILAGVTEYSTSHRRRTYTDYSSQEGKDSINVICMPPGIKSGSWMRVAQSSDYDESTGIYTVTTVYEEADAGSKWDPDLYDSEIKSSSGNLK